MKFEICEYPNATYDAEADIWHMGEAGTVLDTIVCDYPAQMREHLPRRAEYLEQADIAHAWRTAEGKILGVRVA